jgi:hypothetical protein
MENHFSSWNEELRELGERSRNLCRSVLLGPGRWREIVRGLDNSCGARTNAASVLISNKHIFDAEILMRSVIEGTVKVARFATASVSERAGLAQQFDMLWFDATARDQRWLREILEWLPPDNPAYRVLEAGLLPQHEFMQEDPIAKQLRTLRSQWSFGVLCRNLLASQDSILATLAHSSFFYSLGSHFIHHDKISLDAIADVWKLPDAERRSHEAAHRARLMSDGVGMTMARLHMISTYIEAAPRAAKLFQQLDKLRLRLSTVWKEWALFGNE